MSNFTTKIDFLRQVKNFTGLTADSILKDTNVELVGQILLNGQPAYDETNDVLVVGDGITLFENLPKFTSTKYKIFVALVTQTGESAPTMNIF
jgi:alpha-N-acetylglucosamine transferase